jgi:hypothetical protein
MQTIKAQFTIETGDISLAFRLMTQAGEYWCESRSWGKWVMIGEGHDDIESAYAEAFPYARQQDAEQNEVAEYEEWLAHATHVHNTYNAMIRG